MSKGLASRRRSTPWIHRWSRPLIGAIALLGAINTAYLTITRLTNNATVCPTSGCEQVLASPYATVFGQPLSLFGFLAYIGMAILALAPLAVKADEQKQLRATLENTTWLLLFAGATAMLVFSGYLMNIMVTKFVVPLGAKGICYYCIASALFALSLFVLTLLGRSWEDTGQLLFTGIIVAVVTIVGTLGVYAPINAPQTAQDSGVGEVGPPVTTASGTAEIELARHLSKTGAKMYGAYYCSHCYDQKQLFGKEASKDIPYLECVPGGRNAKPEQCQSAGITGFPTWEINGKKYAGTQSLEELARLSGYTGPTNFKNRIGF